MPSTFNKFQDFSNQLIRGVHHWSSDTFKIALTNVLPVSTQTTFDPVTNHAAPAAANGYPSGGIGTTISLADVSGTTTVQGSQLVFTASGGQIGPFRYAVMYNYSASSPAMALVCWFDYGSSITLNDGETLTVQFNSSNPGTILTLT